MKVTLMSHTPDAMNLLLRTKNTRLKHDEDPASWTDEQRAEHLAYMLDTIKSSWEFVDYVFHIEGVTRAFTHQLVRTRQASYAQQSQRTVDVRDQEVLMPESIQESLDIDVWNAAVDDCKQTYKELIDGGTPVQDARGILPTNMTTDIIAKFNLRTLSEMSKVRLCVRTQGEYSEVFREMRKRVLEVHDWAEPFLQVHCVATGTCAFPRYGKTDCKHYRPWMDRKAEQEELRIQFWEDKDFKKNVAIPVARNGKTM